MGVTVGGARVNETVACKIICFAEDSSQFFHPNASSAISFVALQQMGETAAVAWRPPGNTNSEPNYWAHSNQTKTMLKNLSPLHTPELLHTLASMGHGDDIAIVDAHFPAVSMAKRLIRLDGVDAPAALEACLRLIPLDTFVDDPASRMEVVDDPDHIPEVQKQFQKVIDQEEGKHWPLAKIERHAFYERAKKAYAIVITGELRPYGCVLIKKGVVL